MTLKQAIKEYPNGMIYYHDNQSWVYYQRPLTDEELETGEVPDEIEIMTGEDWRSEGYAPDIVVELASIIGIRVESI